MKVFGLTILSFIKSARASGIAIETILQGLSFTEVDLEHLAWVPWNEAAVLFNRLEPLLAEAEIEPFMRRHMESHPLIRVLAQMAASPNAWLDMFWKASVSVNPMCSYTYEIAPHVHTMTSHLLPSLTPCRLWFRLSDYGVRFAPLPVGAAPLQPISVDLGPTHLVGRYAPPVEASSSERRRLASELPLPLVFDSLAILGDALGGFLRDGHLAFDPATRGHVDEVVTLATAWGLTLTEARVALKLAEGTSPAEVARALGLALGTVRVHLRHVYAKSETTGQRELSERVKAWRLR